MPPLRSALVLARLSWLAALAACTAPGRPSPSERVPDDGSGGDPIWNPQGTELLAAPSALEPFSVAATGWALSGAPVTAAEIVDGELALDGRTGAELAGATFTATAPDASQVAMRITAVEFVSTDYLGYWESQGWSDTAIYNTLSRIDYPNSDRIPAKPQNASIV